jgi:hypothetical protein
MYTAYMLLYIPVVSIPPLLAGLRKPINANPIVDSVITNTCTYKTQIVIATIIIIIIISNKHEVSSQT